MEDRQHSKIDALYMKNKSFLFGIAYRMLGTVTDAEDVVQDIYLRICQVDPEQIHDEKSFLAKVAMNHCLDRLKSAQQKREIYVGPWLPEPLLLDEGNPEQTLLRKENVSFALLTLLQQLTPVERAVFLLREVFGFDYAKIAEVIEKTEANCRKINSRSKAKIHLDKQPVHSSRETNSFIYLLSEALSSGHIEKFITSLSDDAIAYTDGGGKIRTAINPIVTRERIAQYLTGILNKSQKYLNRKSLSLQLTPIEMNGETGLAISSDSNLFAILALRVINHQVHYLYFLINPDKLGHAARKLNLSVLKIEEI